MRLKCGRCGRRRCSGVVGVDAVRRDVADGRGASEEAVVVVVGVAVVADEVVAELRGA